MKRNQKAIIVLTGIILIAIIAVLNAMGVIDITGTAGEINGQPLPTPTYTQETTQPFENLSPSNLSLESESVTTDCSKVSAVIILSNAANSQTARSITINLQVIEGAEYIAQSPNSIWWVSSLMGDQKRLVNYRISTNEQWLTANQGTQIVLEAYIEAETTNTQGNVGKSLRVSFTAPGTCTPPETPTPTPDPNLPICKDWSMFHSLRTGDMEIFRLDGIEGRPGFRLYNLTNHSAEDRNPSRSPDGLWVAFQSNRDGNFELYLTDAAGGNLRRLTENDADDINPVFGPDNRKIVYQSNRSGNWDIYLYDRIARQETQLTSGPQDEVNPFWSPNGRYIVYQTNRAGNWDLIILEVNNGEETVLAAQPGNEMYPAYAPNGRSIAFISSSEEGIYDVYIADVDSLGVTRLTNGRAAANLAWSPDSRSIAYDDTRESNLDIYVYRLSTNSDARLTTSPASDYAPTWDCSSLVIYYTSQTDETADIYQAALTGGEPQAMTADPGQDLWPVFNNPKSFGPSLP